MQTHAVLVLRVSAILKKEIFCNSLNWDVPQGSPGLHPGYRNDQLFRKCL